MGHTNSQKALAVNGSVVHMYQVAAVALVKFIEFGATSSDRVLRKNEADEIRAGQQKVLTVEHEFGQTGSLLHPRQARRDEIAAGPSEVRR